MIKGHPFFAFGRCRQFVIKRYVISTGYRFFQTFHSPGDTAVIRRTLIVTSQYRIKPGFYHHSGEVKGF
jgi:hypothetical protein